MTLEEILEEIEGMPLELLERLRGDTRVLVSKERYEDLLDTEKKLLALEAGGVDNWEWYSESLNDAGYWDEDE